MRTYILKIERSSFDESKNLKFRFTSLAKAKKAAQEFKQDCCFIYIENFNRCLNWTRYANSRNWYIQE